MQEFNDPSLNESVARDRYLLNGPRRAMDDLLHDIGALSQTFRAHHDEESNDLLSLIESGVSGLLKDSFHPEEIDYYKKHFLKKFLYHLGPLLTEKTSPFYVRFFQLGRVVTNAKPTLVIKPSVTIKKYNAAVSALVSGVVGLSAMIPHHAKEAPISAPIVKVNYDGVTPMPIPVQMPSSGANAHGKFDSPYAAKQSEEKKAERDLYASVRAEKDAKLQAFRERWKGPLDTHTVHYFDFFQDVEKSLTLALESDTKHAAVEYAKLRESLRAELSGVSDTKFLEAISHVVASPHKDNRNSRSYFADAFSSTKPVGNCELRAKVRLSLIQDLRPELMPHIKLQLLNKHIRVVYQPEGKSRPYGIDFGFEKISRRELDRTVIVSPDDPFVHPLVDGKELHVAPKIRSKNSGAEQTDSPFSSSITGLADAYGRLPASKPQPPWSDFPYGRRYSSFGADPHAPGDLARMLAGYYTDPSSPNFLHERNAFRFGVPISFSDTDIAALREMTNLKELALHNIWTGTISPLIVPDDEGHEYSISPRENNNELARLLRPHQLELLALPKYTSVSSPDFDGVLASQNDLHVLSLPDVQSLSPETVEIFSKIPQLRHVIVNARTITPDTMGAWKKYLERAFAGMGWNHSYSSDSYYQQSFPTFVANSPEDIRHLIQLTGQMKENGVIFVVAPFVTHLDQGTAQIFSGLDANTTLLLPNLKEFTKYDLEMFSLNAPIDSLNFPNAPGAESIKSDVLGLMPNAFEGLEIDPSSVGRSASLSYIRRVYLMKHGQ